MAFRDFFRDHGERNGERGRREFGERERGSARNYNSDVYGNQMGREHGPQGMSQDVGREPSESDWRDRDERLGVGFERRGRRTGSDYYGDNPERYGAGNYDAGAFGAGRYGDREYASGQHRIAADWELEDSDREAAFGGYRESFRGRGPKGYRRSDERIREDVCECLTDDDYIDASNIDVAVQDCEVTLSGTVSSREEKRRAEDLIEGLSGVKDIHNSLRVSTRSTEQDNRQTTARASQEKSGARH